MKLRVILPFFILGSFCLCVQADSKVDFRSSMRDFVMRISKTAKDARPGFIVVAQDGMELLTENGESDGTVAKAYAKALDGVGQEDVFYGYHGFGNKRPEAKLKKVLGWLQKAQSIGLDPMVTDYCDTQDKAVDSYQKNAAQKWISFAGGLHLDTIPTFPAPERPWNAQKANVTRLKQAKNFLYLINPQKYKTHADLVAAVGKTNYDVVILDLYNHGTPLTSAHLNNMRIKPGGGKRLFLCYMSIGEAEDYRPYWNKDWKAGNPGWLGYTNPEWDGNYAVKYWDPNWQKLIVGEKNSYLNQILKAGFDGVYLDKVDEFEFWEEHPDGKE